MGAWHYLNRTGELGDAMVASRFPSDTIELMVRHGERRRLMLANRANRGLSAIQVAAIRTSGARVGLMAVHLFASEPFARAIQRCRRRDFRLG
jgi:hypothetical protein